MDASVTSDIRAIDTEIDRDVPSLSFAEYKTRFADTLDARRLGAVVSDEANLFMFDRWDVVQDKDTCAWNRRCMLLERWCSGTLGDMLVFGMPIIRHAEETGYPRHLVPLVRNINVTSEYRGLNFCCLEDSLDEFYLVQDAEAWWREFELEVRKRLHARGPWLVG